MNLQSFLTSLVILFSWTAIGDSVEYYAMGCSTEAVGNPIEGSHTAFRYVKVRIGSDAKKVISDKIDISWMPANFETHGRLPLVLSVEGKNFSLEKTQQMAKRFGLEFSCFNPVSIDEKLFAAAKSKAAFLNEGSVKYKLFAVAPIRHRRAVNEVGGTVNCIRANSDLAGSIKIEPVHGKKATKAVLGHFFSKRLVFNSIEDKDLRDQILSY